MLLGTDKSPKLTMTQVFLVISILVNTMESIIQYIYYSF